MSIIHMINGESSFRISVFRICLSFFVSATSLIAVGGSSETKETSGPLKLNVADDGKQIKLLVRHSEIGLICELHCYEAGPFHYGKYSKRADGTVVFVHTAGRVTGTTTFTPVGKDRVSMDVLIEGPNEELKQILYLGPCMQLWHSDAFKRRESLAEFAQRCFYFTMRGPVAMMDTARGPMKSFKPDAPENSPPCTQWYVPFTRSHPGDIWAFGTSGDRATVGLVAAASRDGKWLAATACANNSTVGQGWHDCIHLTPQVQSYLKEGSNRILVRNMLYVLPNDKGRLLRMYFQDFPDRLDRPNTSVSTGDHGILKIETPAPNQAPLELSLEIVGPARTEGSTWQSTFWGGYVRSGFGWRMWAYPNADSVDLCVSVEDATDTARIAAALAGRGWTTDTAAGDLPIQLRRSAYGKWVAALMWENGRLDMRDQTSTSLVGTPAPSEEKGGTFSARGRLTVYQGDLGALRERWDQARTEWKNSFPYYMPVREPARTSSRSGIRFVSGTGSEVDEDGKAMRYGLTIVPPWKGGGSLTANFPEHFEHGGQGFGILRYSDKRAYAWKVSGDGRSATFNVESPELPGVLVRASAVAEGDQARLKLKISNRGGKTLERVKPLLCMWYGKLTGFPGKESGNFRDTHIVMKGKVIPLSSVLTSNPNATAKVAYVRGCGQHDCDQFAKSRGGLIDEEIDRALIAVTDRESKRKVLIAFSPGKSILSNSVIPCVHADPYFGPLTPGDSREVEGVIVFTEKPLDQAVKALAAAGMGAAKEVNP